MSERNASKVFVELLRGRDGLQGRDGLPGKAGPPGNTGPQGVQGPPGVHGGGTVYTRWGSRSCPDTQGTKLTYTGVVGSTRTLDKGGAANFLCLPTDPEYSTDLTYGPGVRGHTYINAVGYQAPLQGGDDTLTACSVCHIKSRSAVMMIPAKATCPSNWTREYYGYLMTEYAGNGLHTRYMFECIDKRMETIEGYQAGVQGMLLHHVEAGCNYGLTCGTNGYNSHQELNCVVCTK